MKVVGRGQLVIVSAAIVIVSALGSPGAVASGQTPSQAPAASAALGYWTDAGVIVADEAGQEIRSFPDFEHFSLNGSLLAGELQSKETFRRRIVGYDISSGERLFKIPDAMLPVVAAGGRKVAFLPTYEREGSVMSVWMRTPTGRIRKIAQFRPGPGQPGIRHGMRAGGGPLDIALDENGRTLAVAFGLETIRTFDVWTIDVKTKEATRMTTGNHSHSPSLSPDGKQLVVRVESTDTCPDDTYGEYFMGKLRVISTTTGERLTLTDPTCDLFYDTPRWIDNESLLAVRVTRDGTEEYGFDLDIVRIDAATGAVSEVVTEGNPCCITVSPSLMKVAFPFSDRDGFNVLDLPSGATLEFPAGSYVAHLAGENRF